MNSKSVVKFLKIIRQFSIATAVVGGIFVLNEVGAGSTVLASGGFGLALYFLLVGFQPVPQEPDWTLVYPELAMGFHSDEEDEINTKSNKL